MLAQLLYAVRETMTGSLVCAAGATAIGVVVGAVGGYYGGAVDAAIGWLTGVVVTMPAIALIVLVVIYENPIQPLWLGFALTLYLWTSVARVVRASFATPAHDASSSRRRTPPAPRASASSCGTCCRTRSAPCSSRRPRSSASRS